MLTGMFGGSIYNWFVTEDIDEFENCLIRWVSWVKTTYENKPVLFFNKSNLIVKGRIESKLNQYLYEVKLHKISVEFLCMNGEMCILTKVIRNDSEKSTTLYELPESWDGTTPWYGC